MENKWPKERDAAETAEHAAGVFARTPHSSREHVRFVLKNINPKKCYVFFSKRTCLLSRRQLLKQKVHICVVTVCIFQYMCFLLAANYSFISWSNLYKSFTNPDSATALTSAKGFLSPFWPFVVSFYLSPVDNYTFLPSTHDETEHFLCSHFTFANKIT